MKDKIRHMMARLLDSKDRKTNLQFTHTNKKKSFKANIAYSKMGDPVISLRSHAGYDENYLTKKFREHLSALRMERSLAIQSDDIILTRKFLQNPPPPGATVTLPADTYYYSINDGLMSCNGDQLGASHQARFIKLLTANCSPGSEIQKYSQFKLL